MCKCVKILWQCKLDKEHSAVLKQNTIVDEIVKVSVLYFVCAIANAIRAYFTATSFHLENFHS